MEDLWRALWQNIRRYSKEDAAEGDNEADLYARLSELSLVPLISVFIVILRKAYERFLAVPFSKWLNLSDGSGRKAPQPNPKLEAFYKKSKNPSKEELSSLAKQTDMSVTSVKTWFRRRRNLSRPSMRKKFCEASWRFLFYTFLFLYGMITLWHSPWFWDNQLCWEHFGQQVMDLPTYTYYMLENGFYLSLLFSVMSDIKRKDFTEQLIHHAATIFLITFSYLATFVRVGTLVMAVHDVSDIILELAKCLHYIKKKNLADVLFVLFAIVFIVSRLIVYPFWVIHTSAVKSLKVVHPTVVYYFFNSLLIVLLFLHIFWASIILKMARDMVAKGEVTKDDRSDTEEESDDDGKDD